MGDEWASIRLGDVCTRIGSGATPHGGASVYLDRGGIALIRSQNVYNEGFRREGLAFISQEHARELDHVEVVPDDVLLNITGDSVARCCQVDESILPARVNQHVIVIRVARDRLDARFLRYFLVSPNVQARMLSWAGSGGTRNALTKAMIESFEVLAPKDVEEQRAIARILGTLDDKIELNRRMNETLEAMARALFKSWFVDFEPVRAKMDGHWKRGQSLPGLPAHLFDLFPNRLVDSELGKIPEGWGVMSFSETVEIIGGGTPKTAVPEYWNGGVPWFSVGDMPAASDVWVVDTERKITPSGLQSSSTKILPIGTIIISARGTVGRVAVVGVPMAMNQTCYGLRGIGARQDFFTYFRTRELVGILQQRTHGSVFDTITRATLEGVKVARPSPELVGSFESAVGPILQRIRASIMESRALAVLRDALLPKLISGTIRVGAEMRFGEGVSNETGSTLTIGQSR